MREAAKEKVEKLKEAKKVLKSVQEELAAARATLECGGDAGTTRYCDC